MPVEDETGPCNGVKGAVDVYDPPLEARVPRLDRCCLKQKVGYSRDTAPKNHHFVQEKPDKPLLRCEVRCARPPLLEEKIFCLVVIMGETGDSGHSPGLDQVTFLRVVKKDLLCI